MYANYHTHTYLCRHASGTPREYVENAIYSGIKVLGFSDHVPYPFSKNGYESLFRMHLNDIDTYYTEISQLRDEYKDKIKIYIGYEAEYYPDEFLKMLEHINKYECDYLILGQHCLNNEYDGKPANQPTQDNELLISYVDQVITAIGTGKFTYIAHPDIINYRGCEKIYQQEMARLCTAAKKLNIPLEINLLGLSENRHYPYDVFWKLVRDVGNDIILGFDAHSPIANGNIEIETAGLKYASKFGLKPLKTVELRKV